MATQDDYGNWPDGTIAGMLTPGASLNGAIETLDDVDMFYGSLAPGVLYRFVLTPLTGTPVFDPRYIHEVPTFSGSTALTSSGVSMYGGGYFVAVTSHDLATYRVTLEQVPDDYLQTAATTGRLAAGGSVTGSIDAPNDGDWFAIDLVAGQAYRFGASGDADVLSIRDARGGTGIALPADGSFIPTASGTYYVGVTSTKAGGYVLTATATTDDIGNDAAHARPLPIGGQIAATIDTAADIDAFAVNVAAGRKLALVATGSDMGMRLESQPAGYHVHRAIGGGSFIAIDPDAAGSVTLDVRALTTHGYTVQALDVTADTTAPKLLNVQDAVLDPDGLVRLHFSERVGIDLGDGQTSTWVPDFSISDGGVVPFGTYGSANPYYVHWEGNDLVIAPRKAWQPGGHYTLSSEFLSFVDLAGNTLKMPELRFIAPGSGTQGTARDDAFVGSHLGVRMDGGAGLDTVRYQGQTSEQLIRAQADGSFKASLANGSAPADTLVGIERVLCWDDAIALDVGGAGTVSAGIGGMAYRLYQAAFDRAPDKYGIGYWMRVLEGGASLRNVASGFLDSAEFKHLYGANPTNAEFVDHLYQNVLHRAPDSGGHDYWVGRLDQGAARADILASFSESPENAAAVAQVIGNGFVYSPMY